jgi:endonuclease YncB( thermonuclease family)
MIARKLLLCLLLCGIPVAAQAEKFIGRVIVVIDGDTVLVAGHGHPLKIRLADIDAPEKSQDFGMASRDALMRMVLHKRVEVDTLAIDKYGRTVALLKDGKLNVNGEMVRRGMAWAAIGWRHSRRAPTGVPLAGAYSRFHSDRRYLALQQEAQQAKRGLWQQADPVPPWQWRSRHVTGEASRLRERPPAARPTAEGLTQDDVGQRKDHAAQPGVLPVLKPGDYTCGTKRHCLQMRSCNEAHYYLTVGGVKALNPEGDGVPCRNLCMGR